MNSFNDLDPSIEPIDQVSEHDARPAVLGQVVHQLVLLLLRHRLEQADFTGEPIDYTGF